MDGDALRRQLQTMACCFPSGSSLRAELEAVAEGPHAQLLHTVSVCMHMSVHVCIVTSIYGGRPPLRHPSSQYSPSLPLILPLTLPN